MGWYVQAKLNVIRVYQLIGMYTNKVRRQKLVEHLKIRTGEDAHTHSHTYTHTCIHTDVHTFIPTQPHTYSRTHSLSNTLPLPLPIPPPHSPSPLDTHKQTLTCLDPSKSNSTPRGNSRIKTGRTLFTNSVLFTKYRPCLERTFLTAVEELSQKSNSVEEIYGK